MVELKQHALPVAFYILTIFMMINCECEININPFSNIICYDSIRNFPTDQDYSTLIEKNKIFNYIICKNLNISEISTFKPNKLDLFDISNSVISTLEPFKKSCILKLSNITMNISNTHVLNETNLRSLSIISSDLTTFDLMPIPTLKILDLSDNALTSLNTTNFRNLKLDILNVSSNRLSNIDCENVAIQIDLSNNNLDMINCKFATTLKVLYLNNNNLRNISMDVFKEMHSLFLLDLSYNQFDEVPYIFQNLENLEHLKLSNNNIYRFHFGSFINLKSLQSFDVSYNEIVSLPLGIFTGLHELKLLDLSYNNIFELDVKVFNPIYFLNELYLEGNSLQDLDITILENFPYLRNISVTFAHINCYKLKDYVDTFENNHVNVKSGAYYYLDNVNGIKCTTENAIDLYKFSLELSLNSLKRVHVTLTTITVCFLVIMLMFVVIQYYRYKM